MYGYLNSYFRCEQVDAIWLRDQVAGGRVVIPANKRHKNLSPCGIGEGLTVKVNANIGTSSDRDILEEEDGPMLTHGLQGLHGKPILLPRSSKRRPSPERLEVRYDRYLSR